ncbi:ABC transporter ATP-binding protein [Atopobium minutum]|uniref:ABC transporter ATP-binding protein n=1 Tax=Atopobium minutum TaxID=1381 RepID=UPI0025D60CCC|nr:energy-coupling factor transporter ATPase [Atopobium minutum]
MSNAHSSYTLSNKPIAHLSEVSLRYKNQTALDAINLSINPGERICVLGANGSGKSSLASVLCGLLAPDEGSVTLIDQAVCTKGSTNFAAYRKARRWLGLVFQNPDDQIVTSIVEDDIAFGPENLGVDPQEITQRVTRELHRVALDAYAKANPSHLSGGQKQRVAIAGALAMEPKLLVLDEPGALLDVRGRRGIMHVMNALSAQGTTIVHVTHFMEEALKASRVLVLSKGKIVLDGTPQVVFSQVDQLAQLELEEPFIAQLSAKLVQEGVPVSWTCDEKNLCQQLALQLQSVSTTDRSRSGASNTPTASGAPTASGTPVTPTTSDVPAVQARKLSYSYAKSSSHSDSVALNEVSFTIPQGAYTSIIGQTGSGKSTLARLICGLEHPDSGELFVGPLNLTNKRDRHKLHGQVGYVMQHPERQLFAQTVLEDVAYGPKNLGFSTQEANKKARQALQEVGLLHKQDASPFELSGGQARLCAIAGILAMQPKILLLDEPTAGLDPAGRETLHRLLVHINQRGTTVVQITHSMEDAATSDRLIVLDQSRILMCATPREIYQPHNRACLRAAGLDLPYPLIFANALEAEVPHLSLGQPLTMNELIQTLIHLLSPAIPDTASAAVHTRAVRNPWPFA